MRRNAAVVPAPGHPVCLAFAERLIPLLLTTIVVSIIDPGISETPLMARYSRSLERE